MPPPDSQSLIQLAGTLAVPSISLLGSAVVASLSYFLGRKKQIEEDQRKVKVEVYEGFYRALTSAAISRGNQPADISEAFNRMLFTGSDDVVQCAVTWWTEVTAANNKADLTSAKIKTLLDTMRKDLGISRRPILKNSPFIGIGPKPQ
jgi:hypothetical protein